MSDDWNGNTTGEFDEIGGALAEAFGETAYYGGENGENDGVQVVETVETAPAPVAPAPAFVSPALPPSGPARPVGPQRWVVPILAGDTDAEFDGPFYRTDSEGAPLLDLHEYVAVQDAANKPARWERGPHLGFLSHDVDESQILELMGPGHYLVALRTAGGKFLRVRSVSVGRVEPIGRQARVAGLVRRPDLGSPAPSPDEPPAWARALMAKVDGLEAQRQVAMNPLAQLNEYAQHLQQGLGALQQAHSGIGNVLAQIQPPAPAVAAPEAPDEAEPDMMDEVGEKLGGVVSGIIKAKSHFDQLQLVFGMANNGGT